MNTEWIVVADNTRALIFARSPRSITPHLVEAIGHAAGRAQDKDLRSDKMGRVGRDGQAGGQAYEPKTSPADVEAERFAKELGDYLNTQFGRGRFGALSLVMPPKMLGRVKSELNDPTLKIIRMAAPHDLVSLDTAELVERVVALRAEAG
jgi:protein required for attachment to host cells